LLIEIKVVILIHQLNKGKMNYLTASEAPQTKLRLKKAILKGEIKVYENDMNNNQEYKLIEGERLTRFWEGVFYAVTRQNPNEPAWATLGTSFYYKFSK
jgi:hypothetical protein